MNYNNTLNFLSYVSVLKLNIGLWNHPSIFNWFHIKIPMLFCKFSKETVFLYFQVCKDDDVQLLVFPQALTRVIWGAHETVVVIWGVIWHLIWQGGNRSFGEIINQSCNCRLSSAWPWVLAYLASCCRLDLPIVFYSPTVLLPTLLYSNNLSFFHPGGFALEVPISYEAFNCFSPDQTLFFQLTPLRDFQREQEKEKEFRIKWREVYERSKVLDLLGKVPAHWEIDQGCYCASCPPLMVLKKVKSPFEQFPVLTNLRFFLTKDKP